MPKNSPHKQDIDRAIKALKNNGTTQALAKKWGLAGAK
jgi:ABC-type amino acid transport substrate-binding protein